MTACTVTRLAWSDAPLGSIELPRKPMRIVKGFGSGLARSASDPPDIVWAVGDRGPNVKPKTLVEMYGLDSMRDLQGQPGAKVMPRLDLGPALAKLRVHGDRVELLEEVRLAGRDGVPICGLPIPEGGHARCEPAFDLGCKRLQPDPSGLDTEGIAALAGGEFWLGDEFGPSLVRVDRRGRVLARHVPEGVTLEGAQYPVQSTLPALAARRQLNRGFEAISLSPDEGSLFLAFQSPLAHPDEDAHEHACHVRVWQLDAATLAVERQFLYPFDPPESFARDTAKGEFKPSDRKVSELIALDEDRLLLLERGSETTKLYRVALSDDLALPAGHLSPDTRPTVEELSAASRLGLPELGKELLFSSDDAPEIAADLEGMVVLSPRELLIVNDNDFGVEGAATSFSKLTFAEPVLA